MIWNNAKAGSVTVAAGRADTGKALCYPCKYLMNDGGMAQAESRADRACVALTYREVVMTTDLLGLGDIPVFPYYSHLSTKISKSCYLASFNKLSAATLSVPGFPPLFRPPTKHLRVNHRPSGSENPRYAHPFEPLIHAVTLTTPTYHLSGTDIITTATTLRKLFVLITNTCRLTNRFDLEMRGNTLFMSPWVHDPSYTNGSGNYGLSFKDATCQFPPSTSREGYPTSHHRIEAYEFGGLKCVVQTVVDGYICRDSCWGHRGEKISTHHLTPAGSGLSIFKAGGEIPGSCLVEVEALNSSRSSQTGEKQASLEAQMYFSRRKRLYIAEHHGGVFSPDGGMGMGIGTGIVDVGEQLKIWEGVNRAGLGKLANLLWAVKGMALASKMGEISRVSLICESDGLGDQGGCRVGLYARVDGARLVPEHTGVIGWDPQKLSVSGW